MTLKHVDVTIEGIAPLLMHRPDMEALETPHSGKKSEADKEEEAKRAAYRNGRGLIWPSGNLKACLVEATSMSGLKRGKRGLMTYVRAGLFIDPVEIPFGKKEPDDIFKHLGRIPPGKKGALVVLRRPRLYEWKLSFKLVVIDPLLGPDQLQKIVEYAGQYVGIGAWRPEHGRFEVTRFEAVGT